MSIQSTYALRHFFIKKINIEKLRVSVTTLFKINDT